MNKPRYIAHYGKGQPVGDDVMVEVVFKTKLGLVVLDVLPAGDWNVKCWRWGVCFDPIVAYRVLDDE